MKTRVLMIGAVLATLAGCGRLGGLVGTRIEVTGTRRTLQEQVLGVFERLGNEVYVLAGVRSIDPVTGEPSPPAPMTPSEARALQARRRMEFNRDDVESFLGDALVGEGNDGLLVTFDEPVEALAVSDPARHRLVGDVVAEENADRTVVMQRIVDVTPDISGPDALRTVGGILADRLQREAPPGAQVQGADGTWTRKEP